MNKPEFMDRITITKKHAPYYKQIEEVILKEIQEKEIKPEEAVLSENRIIKRFGVSSTTARRVLNDLEDQGILERIQGRGSFLKRSWEANSRVRKKIGFIFGKIDANFPGNTGLINEIGNALHGDNKDLLLLGLKQGIEFEKKHIQEVIRDQKISAFLLYGLVTIEDFNFVTNFGLPVLVVGNNGLPIEVPQVKLGAYEAGELVASLLVDCGYRQIGMINGARFYPIAVEMYDGFRKVLEEKGVYFRDDLVCWTAYRHAYRETREILERLNLSEPTALFCEEGTIQDVLLVLKEKKIIVPKELGIIVNTGEKNYFLDDNRPLNAVAFSIQTMGEKVALALKKLEVNQELTYQDKVVQPVLKVGESLRPPENMQK